MEYYTFVALAPNVPLNPDVPFYSAFSIQDREKNIAGSHSGRTLVKYTR